MIRIATIANANKITLETIFKQHNLPYRLDALNNGKGYYVFVERNHDLYFREVITPEYQAAVKLMQSKEFVNIFGSEQYAPA